MFFPYRTNLIYKKTPIVSVLFCLLAVFIMVEQKLNQQQIDRYAGDYCMEHPHVSLLAGLNSFLGKQHAIECKCLFSDLHNAFDPDRKIFELVSINHSAKSADRMILRDHFISGMHSAYKDFELTAPANISRSFSFTPGHNNPATMLSSAFAHTGWEHLIGNLLFFLVFAIAIEAMAGHLGLWFSVITLSVGSNLFYFFSVSGSSAQVPTLGLSGVIMGLMMMLVFFYPHMRIRFLPLFLPVWRPAAPVWFVALVYVGWDLYQYFFSRAADDGVNVVSHISGAALGYLLGLIAFSRKRRMMLKSAVETAEKQVVFPDQ